MPNNSEESCCLRRHPVPALARRSHPMRSKTRNDPIIPSPNHALPPSLTAMIMALTDLPVFAPKPQTQPRTTQSRPIILRHPMFLKSSTAASASARWKSFWLSTKGRLIDERRWEPRALLTSNALPKHPCRTCIT